MADYEILIDGKSKAVELSRTGSNIFTAKIAGKPRRIELYASKIDFEQIFSIKVDGKTYQAKMCKGQQEKAISVEVEEAKFKAEIRSPEKKPIYTNYQPPLRTHSEISGTVEPTDGEGAVVAPMTGRIVRVYVKRGDSVMANQVLCTIEAMKMENEIASPRAGSVKEVNARDGSPVSEGDVLFIVV
jgi:biotin carboxyl carrier protein